MAETPSSATPANSDDLAPGTQFGRYAIVRRVDTGGMGAVYEATHLELKKRVAIKVLRAEILADATRRARFLREGAIAARLRHPHVVDITDVGECDGIPFLVMEFLEGEPLSALLERTGAMTLAQICEILLPVMAAVDAAHEAGIVHRDLKPENVFLVRGRHGAIHPKLLDFGISKTLDEGDAGPGLTASTTMLGTPFYMSPEQARDSRKVTAASDQFALGVMLYEFAVGERPFDGPSTADVIAALVRNAYKPPRALRPALPAGFEAAIVRALAPEPEGRFPTVRHLARALLPFASPGTRAQWDASFPAHSAPPPPTDPAERTNRGAETLAGPDAPVAAPAAASPDSLSGRSVDVRTLSARVGRRGAVLIGAVALALAVIVPVAARLGRSGATRGASAGHSAPAASNVARAVPAPSAPPTPPTAALANDPQPVAPPAAAPSVSSPPPEAPAAPGGATIATPHRSGRVAHTARLRGHDAGASSASVAAPPPPPAVTANGAPILRH